MSPSDVAVLEAQEAKTECSGRAMSRWKRFRNRLFGLTLLLSYLLSIVDSTSTGLSSAPRADLASIVLVQDLDNTSDGFCAKLEPASYALRLVK